MPRLLVFTPTFANGPLPVTLASIAALQFDGELVHEVSWHNPYPGKDNRNVVAQYSKGRQMTLDGGYDAMLCVEHDMVIPPNAAQTLWDDGAPVVYAVYLLRHESYVINVFTAHGRRLGKPMSFYPAMIEQARRDKRIECAGLGFGCTLIRREVLERIPMRDEDGNAPDTPFAKDCLRKGFQQVARFDVACQHIEKGVVLEPFADGGVACRVYAPADAAPLLDGEPWILERGRYYTLPPPLARLWAAKGYVRITSGAGYAS